MRGRTALGIAAVILIASVAVSPDAAVGTDPAPNDTHESAFTAAACDENDQAFDVGPDTPEAWADADDWCTRSGDGIKNAPWPSGFKPAPLPVQLDSDR